MLKYRELYDYILGVLYILKRQKQYGFFSLKDIVGNLGARSVSRELYGIAKYLEAEGYVNTLPSLGDVFVEITPSGIIYIEEKDENFIQIFEKFIEQQKSELQFEKIASGLSKTKTEASRKPIIAKVSHIISYLNSNKILKKSDINADVKILKLELQKTDPDKEVISIKLSKMAELSELRNQSLELREYLDGYIDTAY
ncbi:hypothetical protein QUF80_08105 [Desulfococcaceae bacterium HSG8]|nr:hypothetical protein [Desulfococcaceae bacterium HSG8]